MRLFADANITRRAVEQLRLLDHNVVWAGDRDQDPGDGALLAEALADQRVFVTKDRDLGRIVFRDAAQHFGVLLIDELHTPATEAELILAIIDAHAAALNAGAFVRAGASGVRIARRSGD